MDRKKVLAEVSSQLMVSQIAQLRLWQTDDVQIDRLEIICVEIADSILSRCGWDIETDE